jgi:hypothetical protein
VPIEPECGTHSASVLPATPVQWRAVLPVYVGCVQLVPEVVEK